MNTAEPGSSGPHTPKTDAAESNGNVKKSDTGDLDPRDTAHSDRRGASGEECGKRMPGLILAVTDSVGSVGRSHADRTGPAGAPEHQTGYGATHLTT
jgi:hypothetical protein